jgi:hypothetical protein
VFDFPPPITAKHPVVVLFSPPPINDEYELDIVFT